MSQLRLFLYHIYYKLKDISVLSSLRLVSLEETVMRVCMQCYGIFAWQPNKWRYFLYPATKFLCLKSWAFHSLLKWAEREKAQVDREGENLLHFLHIYTLGSAQPMWRSCAIILLSFLWFSSEQVDCKFLFA